MFAFIGFILIYSFIGRLLQVNYPELRTIVIIATPVLFGVVGLVFAPRMSEKIARITENAVSKLSAIPAKDIFCAVLGLVSGLVIGALLGTAFGRINLIGPYISLILIIFFGWLGLLIGYRRREDILSLLKHFRSSEKGDKSERNEKNDRKNMFSARSTPKILDTSVIIDGRIADIYKTGFVEGDLIIPDFVLEELRHIADSSDSLKRNRGRRGLDILNKLRDEFENSVRISEKQYPDIAEVDSKLLKMAQDLHGVVLTNDFNLNKVAQFQGVKVLNINELSNAVKPVVLPGEEMVVLLLKDGKELGQGVAYLDDGTMIVVENGRRYLNKTIVVVVTSVLQTAAGRMIFARPKLNRDGEAEEAVGI